MELYLDFSVDYSGECEDYTLFIDDVERTHDFDFEDITDYVKKLEENVENFNLSEHRTTGTINIFDGVMTIDYKFYTEPDWNEFEEHTITTTPINFI